MYYLTEVDDISEILKNSEKLIAGNNFENELQTKTSSGKAKEFKLARIILVNLYNRESI